MEENGQYSASELDLLCAITAQECGSSYSGALAVITCAANRAESSRWRRYGSDPLSQYMAPNQFCYSIDMPLEKKIKRKLSKLCKTSGIRCIKW